MIRELCGRYTNLTEDDISEIMQLSKYLPYFCELAEADFFIDCFSPGIERGVVVAHGRPLKNSQYQKSIQGDIVLPENEPIVFYTMKTGKPIRDAKGFSQEGKWVLQHTMPVISKTGKTIAVLIEESDVTEKIETDLKLRQIEKSRMGNSLEKISSQDEPHEVIDKFTMLQEMHHRIKNSLQTVSSILSMQVRRSRSEETRDVLKDNINRINNIAQIHETLMSSGERNIELNNQISILADNMMNYANGEGKNISIEVSGDKIITTSNKLLSILMVINELLTNSVKHGYVGKKEGKIDINLVKGTIYSTVIVKDDGIGMEAADDTLEKSEGLGNILMRMMVKEDLKGTFNVDSGRDGTCSYFDFTMY